MDPLVCTSQPKLIEKSKSDKGKIQAAKKARNEKCWIHLRQQLQAMQE